MAAIDLKEVMKIIKSGEWFSLRLLTANISTNTGGKIIEFKRCRIARRKTMEQHGTPTTGSTGFTKDPRHNFNFTVNLELQNKQIRQVHPILIFEMNKQPVL